VKPYVHQPEKKFKNVIEGDPFVMDCKAWGHPEVTLSWMHNKQPIVLDERIIFKADSLNTTLRITHTEYNDAGDFECIAQNNYGNASVFMEMHVKGMLCSFSKCMFLF
jgi:Immunoglobulin I-set domain